MTEYLTTDTDLKKVADAIREMTGGTDPLSFPDGFVSAIEGGGVANQVWVWNDIPAHHASFNTNIDFVNSGISYDVLDISIYGPESAVISYAHSDGTTGTTAFDGDVNKWYSPAYRAIVLKTPPTGELLTYLQANATQM